MHALTHSDLPVYTAHPVLGPQGWSFRPGAGVVSDGSTQYIRVLYTNTQADYTGVASLPVLWDCHQGRIVTNHSDDCMRLLNTAAYYPTTKQDLMQTVSRFIRHYLYDAIYKTGAATSQLSYEESVAYVFDALNELDVLLEQSPYVVGKSLTAVDCQLWAILSRFDAVYYDLFRCNKKHLWDYPHISAYLKSIYKLPGVSETFLLDHIQTHYYASPRYQNTAIRIPVGPDLPWL